jgi:hypothetical protein
MNFEREKWYTVLFPSIFYYLIFIEFSVTQIIHPFNIFSTLDLKFTKSRIWFRTIWWICDTHRDKHNHVHAFAIPFIFMYTQEKTHKAKNLNENLDEFCFAFLLVLYIFFWCRLTSIMNGSSIPLYHIVSLEFWNTNKCFHVLQEKKLLLVFLVLDSQRICFHLIPPTCGQIFPKSNYELWVHSFFFF